VKYAVIDATYGGLSLRDDEPDWDALVGPQGKDWIILPPSLNAAGWVNGCGHVDPVLPRNIVGSCLLYALGARLQPQAGPVVITGWEWGREPVEICSLELPDYALPSLHRQVREAIDGTHSPRSLDERRWGEEIREAALRVRYAARPRLTVSGGV
jgi:hypothetical protein